MEKCKAYHIVKRPRWNRELGWFEVTDEECWGTREIEYCSCGGDPNKCTAYPNKKEKEKKMNTAEMWLKAQEDGKTYKANDVIYQKNIGFMHANDLDMPWFNGSENSEYIEEFLKASGWKELKLNIMTKEEAEKEFGIKIVGD